MKIAVVFNPSAGRKKIFSEIGKDLNEKLKNQNVITGEAGYGKNYIYSEKVIALSGTSFLEKLEYLMNNFIEENPDIIIGVGGDGILTHIASILLKRNIRIPLMGIAGGTANVGPLIRFNASNLLKMNFENFSIEEIPALKVNIPGKSSLYAFNDIVIGDTFLGTQNGNMVNLSVKDFLKFKMKIVKEPQTNLFNKNFTIKKNKTKISGLFLPAQIVLSPLYKRKFYIGKAVSGSLCLADYFDNGAVICLSDTILIDSNLRRTPAPILSQHILFGKNDSIEFENLSEDLYFILDGNPTVKASENVSIEYIENAIDSVIFDKNDILPILEY